MKANESVCVCRAAGMDASSFLVGICCFLLMLCEFSSPSLAVDICPEPCDCQHSQHLMCTNRGLHTVPKSGAMVSDDTLVFSLGGNFIANISALDFTRYINLVRLNLQYNQIANIHPKAFEKLSKLEELYLGHNLLTSVAVGTLQPLKKLTILYGNNNAIRKITPALFSNLDNLVKLRLDGNAIEVLQDSVFKSLTNLHYLHLEHNKVQHIHRNAFSRLTSLRFLNLAHNKQGAVRSTLTFSQLRALTTLLLSDNEIQYIENHVFRNLKKLSKLSLSNNRISRLGSDSLRGLSSLRELMIDGNEMVEIPAGLLDPLEYVEELDFSRNRISNVDSLAFSRLKYLKILKLKNNFLTSLSGDIFALNNVLYDLDLHGNNWTCDCRLEELKRWMTAAHSQGKLLTVFVQCHYPASLRGKYLEYVNSSQMQPLGNWSQFCKHGAGPEESRSGGVVAKVEGGARGVLDAKDGGRMAEDTLQMVKRNNTKVEDRDNLGEERRDETTRRREGDKREREGQDKAGLQGDQGGTEVPESSIPKGKKPKRESRLAAEAAEKRAKGRRKANVISKIDPTTTFPSSQMIHIRLSTHSPAQAGGEFDLLRSDQDSTVPIIADPCLFNHHFITNVSVDRVTSSTVTVYWTTREHHPYTPRLKPNPEEVHYRVMFDRFGTADRFPRYVYAPGASRSVILRELSSGVTYMVCVEGVVGGTVCQVAPRDHCAGLVTLSEGMSHGDGLTSDLQLVTVATLAGNAVLLLVIGGIWLGRSLKKKLQRRKSAVHVRHMYSTRRPFRPAMATASVSTDFTGYQSSRPTRLAPLEEGDLIEFPCDRFLDNCIVRRDSDL